MAKRTRVNISLTPEETALVTVAARMGKPKRTLTEYVHDVACMAALEYVIDLIPSLGQQARTEIRKQMTARDYAQLEQHFRDEQETIRNFLEHIERSGGEK